MRQYLYQILYQLRVHHWVKNILVAIPVFFAQQAEWLWSTSFLFVFLAFCITSSVVYLMNDLVDLPSDRQHPQKKLRPLASGFFSSADVIRMLVLLVALLMFCLSQLSASIPIIIIYLLLQVAYTFVLKRMPILDVSCIGIGFVLRILAGGWEAEIWISNWLISLVFLLTTGLAIAKRRNDVAFLAAQKTTWSTYPKYNQKMLDGLLVFFFTTTFVVYTCYSMNTVVEQRLGSSKIYITSIFVFLGLARYLWVSFAQNRHPNSPVTIFWKDGWLLLIMGAWLISFSLLIYG